MRDGALSSTTFWACSKYPDKEKLYGQIQKNGLGPICHESLYPRFNSVSCIITLEWKYVRSSERKLGPQI